MSSAVATSTTERLARFKEIAFLRLLRIPTTTTVSSFVASLFTASVFVSLVASCASARFGAPTNAAESDNARIEVALIKAFDLLCLFVIRLYFLIFFPPTT